MNPLLSISFAIPFDQIEAPHVVAGIRELIAQAQAAIQAVIDAPAPRTYANTLLALDRCTEPLDVALNVVRHLETVVTTQELREAFNAIQPEASAFYSSIALNPGLWAALKAFAATEEAAQLLGLHSRNFTKTMDAFRRAGAELDEAGKKRSEAIDVELANVSTKYSENVLDATNAYELYLTDEAQLSGLPPSARAAARQSAESKGLPGWRFTLQQPSYLAVMTYLDDAATRETLYQAFSTRASTGDLDNRSLTTRLIELRREKAALLGFATFADLVLVERMAKTGAAARACPNDPVEAISLKTNSSSPSPASPSPPGISPTGPKSNASPFSTSTKKSSAPTSPFPKSWKACSKSPGASSVFSSSKSPALPFGMPTSVSTKFATKPPAPTLAASTPTSIPAKTSVAAPGWILS